MGKVNAKAEVAVFASFLVVLALLLTNGFSARIFAQEEEAELYEKIEPIGDVLAEVLQNYVYEPDIDKAVEGALKGIMLSLDPNSAYLPAEDFRNVRDETEGAFDGIGIRMNVNKNGQIYVVEPIPGTPAFKGGMRAGDIIIEIDGVSTEGMDSRAVMNRIKGPRGQSVHLKLLRPQGDGEQPIIIEKDITRGKIPVESIDEARILDGGIGYIRISDFKKKTARELRDKIDEFKEEGLKSLIVDLRWNPGGLLNSSREVSELFLPKNTLVTFTRSRVEIGDSHPNEDKLLTERDPVLPLSMPLIVLVSDTSASSSEIVTGALQFHRRALIVGEKTFGKGSVQTIIPLTRPRNSAIRLTTALYYTPAGVTIDKIGILPDVEVAMARAVQRDLRDQMNDSYLADVTLRNAQDHGRATNGSTGEESVNDVVLERALEILREDTVFENLLKKYHRDTKDTQVAAIKQGNGGAIEVVH